MKRISLILIAICLLGAVSISAQLILPRPSPKATVMQTVGLTDISIVYSRPGVKGRKIWGDLVPYGKVWRTGANESTIFSFKDDVTINGNKLAKGDYSLHTIPTADEWTLIFNSAADPAAGYSYDEKKDVLRIKVKPLPAEHQEWLLFSFPNVSMTSADAVLHWEKVKVPITIAVDSLGKAREAAKAAVARLDDWRTPMQAASFALQSDLDWEEATTWIDRSIAIQANYSNLWVKARMLADAGKTSEAIATAERAIKVGKEKDPKLDVSAAEKAIAEWKAKR